MTKIPGHVIKSLLKLYYHVCICCSYVERYCSPEVAQYHYSESCIYCSTITITYHYWKVPGNRPESKKKKLRDIVQLTQFETTGKLVNKIYIDSIW